MKIALHAGLVLRRGDKTFEIVRQIDDDRYLVEDCITRRPSTLDRLTILKRIWDRTYVLVVPSGSSQREGASTPKPDLSRIDVGSLPQKSRDVIERCMSYVSALQKAHVTRGDRKSTRLNSSHTDISRMPSSA